MGLKTIPSNDELKFIFRSLAKKKHPDTQGTDVEFIKLSEAYKLLKQKSKRRFFKNKNVAQTAQSQTIPNNADSKSLTISKKINLSFNEACVGTTRAVEFNRFLLKTRNSICKICSGTGQVFINDDSMKRCAACNSKSFVVKTKKVIRIPAGIVNDTVLRFSREGHTINTLAGFLEVKVFVNMSSKLKRKNLDIYQDINVTYSDLLLGSSLVANTIHGNINIKIPFGSFDGDILRVKNHGIKIEKKQGNHVLTLRLVSPKILAKKQIEALKYLKSVGL
jgi:DnaJ-class molecular chaperone